MNLSSIRFAAKVDFDREDMETRCQTRYAPYLNAYNQNLDAYRPQLEAFPDGVSFRFTLLGPSTQRGPIELADIQIDTEAAQDHFQINAVQANGWSFNPFAWRNNFFRKILSETQNRLDPDYKEPSKTLGQKLSQVFERIILLT